MNFEVDYDYDVERKNTSDMIAGGIYEEANEFNTIKKKIQHTVSQ